MLVFMASAFELSEKTVIKLAKEFDIPLSVIPNVKTMFDLNRLRFWIHGCLLKHLLNQDMCYRLISENLDDIKKKEDILRRLYLMSAIAEPDASGNLPNDMSAINMNAHISMTVFHYVDYWQREFEKLSEEKKNKSTMCYILNEYMEMASDIVGLLNVTRFLRIALDLCMYDSRRSFWTGYNLRHIKTFTEEDGYLQIHTAELEEVLKTHDTGKIEKMETGRIKESICDFILSDAYYKAEAEQIKKKLKTIHYEKLAVDKSTEPTCIRCDNRVQNIILKPCGHVCICDECYFDLEEKRCPCCEANIDEIINLLDFYKANRMNDDWKHSLKIYSTQMKLQSFPELQTSTRNPYSISL